ncbi:MAG: hypothetical protein M5U09_20070 [Gammaproteobacteria bacterium]|nr:hypothetical protein [Gammaproteobacteria bacterium]
MNNRELPLVVVVHGKAGYSITRLGDDARELVDYSSVRIGVRGECREIGRRCRAGRTASPVRQGAGNGGGASEVE